MEMIEVKGLKKVVVNRNQKYTILNSLSMKIHKGEFIAIMGPSGSGKSTFLNILGGLDAQYEGELNILGNDLHNMKENDLLIFRRKHIGMIFQDFNLIQTLSVRDNLRLPLLFTKQKDNKDEKIDNLLNMVGLYSKKNENCSYLSGGEKQRVAIARAFMLNPELLLADEPTGALDSKNSERVMKLLKNFNEELGTTVVLVTHDQHMASYGSRKLFLKDGVFV